MRILLFIILAGIILPNCSSQKNHSISIVNEKHKIKKIVLIDPFFVYNDYRKKNPMRFIKSDNKNEAFIEIIKKQSKKQSYTVDIKNVAKIKNDESDYFEDLLPLKNAIFSSVSKTEFYKKNKKSPFNPVKAETQTNKYPYLIDPSFSELSKKYKTKYFAISGVVSNLNKANINYFPLILLPPLGFSSLQPVKDSYYYFFLADVEKGEIIYHEIRYHKERMTDITMNSLVFDTFKIMKKI